MRGLSKFLAEYRKLYIHVAILNLHNIYWEPAEWIRQILNMDILKSHQQNETNIDIHTI